jgi:glycosyltransferase involved in cell wall biosynthesis
LVHQIPAVSAEELERKLELLAKAGPLTEVERRLGFLSPFEQNLLELLRRIPANTHEERERKIASLIPRKARAAAIAQEKDRPGDYNSYLVGLAGRIPADTPAELERKIASLIPRNARTPAIAQKKARSPRAFSSLVRLASLAMFNSAQEWNRKKLNAAGGVAVDASGLPPESKLSMPSTFTPSVAAFTQYEENLLRLLRQIPAKTPHELEQKIASLIAERGRAAAIARAKERSEDADSYLVNLARHIVATNPRELDQKISLLIPVVTAPPSDGRGAVCIVTRKPIHNVTRAPRMAKALVDAGYRVVVVSPAPPVDDLRNMCPQVEYIVAEYRAFTHDVISRLEARQKERRARLEARERQYQAAVAKRGWRALMRRSGRAMAMRPARAAVRLPWLMLVVAPSAFLLKSPSQSFAKVWRDLKQRDALGIAIKYVWTLTQWASSHAFAAKADELTAGRHFDVVQAYDNYGLVAGARLAERTGAKLVYDAVEIATDRVHEDLNILEKIRERLERREERGIFLKADRMIGTGDALAGWYVKRYRIPKPLVMRNCRYYWRYRQDGRLRADIGAKPDTRIMLWCGGAYPQQGIEVAIRTLPHLPPQIHLAVVTDIADMWRKYVTVELPAIAESFGVADRFHVLPEREPNDLVPYVSGGDIGFVLSVPVDHPNQYYNLPNKFFECVMARMPIGTLAFPEVVSLVNKYEIGSVLDEHDSVKNAAIIRQMLEPEVYATLKANVMKAAQILCWENESRPYVELIDSLMPASQRQNAHASRGETQRARRSMAAKPMPNLSMPAMVSAQTGTD